eukprot:GHVO01021616.1.p2 GENE.GHVO01021616.1~~GHVO01021616.1.p2  ORF type:complete len:293 (-),score=49.67 GHVO01021616.1:1055-1933(-)
MSEGFFLGSFVSMSSTALCVQIVGPESEHKDSILGILLVQDGLFGIVLGILSCFSEEATMTKISMKIGVLLTGFVCSISMTTWLSSNCGPLCIQYLKRLENRSVSSAALICLAISFLASYTTEVLDLSLELGAFLSGLLFAEHHCVALDSLGYMSSIWASLFFCNIGNFIDPVVIWDNLTAIVFLIFVVFTTKFLSITSLLTLTGKSLSAAVACAIPLAHVGEFAFILAGRAASYDIISRKVSLLLSGTTALSLLLTPILLRIISVGSSRTETRPTQSPTDDIEMSPDRKAF